MNFVLFTSTPFKHAMCVTHAQDMDSTNSPPQNVETKDGCGMFPFISFNAFHIVLVTYCLQPSSRRGMSHLPSKGAQELVCTQERAGSGIKQPLFGSRHVYI